MRAMNVSAGRSAAWITCEERAMRFPLPIAEPMAANVGKTSSLGKSVSASGRSSPALGVTVSGRDPKYAYGDVLETIAK